MSRVGIAAITVPAGISIDIVDNKVVVKGGKGELVQEIPDKISLKKEADKLTVVRKGEAKETKALHGLVRSLVANMIQGVDRGFEKRLELVGTGYRVAKSGNGLKLSLGFSHPIEVSAQEGIILDIEGETKIIVSGIDKQKVGQVAAEIRALRKPEPYKGKGIKYAGEVVRRKQGKAAKTEGGE